ncbi:hypothetical protein D9757_012948 [Collybiopsis confluens]|uniref:Uncharacterized protein n=1 Tax=Collybiopsis confluens TaxID=2823264 RepID=A0A8H5D5Y8_9AGAR|nr:hypothetical protein D9757_012948 [Collybiopsis confluens]
MAGASFTPGRPDYPKPYRSSHKLKTSKSTAFSSYVNARNHENHWHAPYNCLFHELTEPYDTLVAHPQYRQWRLSSERTRTTCHRHPTSSASENLPTVSFSQASKIDNVPGNPEIHLEAEYASSEPDVESEDQIVAAYVSSDWDVPSSDPQADISEQAANAPDTDQEFYDLEPDLAFVVSYKDSNTMPDMVLLHQQMVDLPKVNSQSEDVEKIRYEHRCGVRPLHECLALIGEYKRNISRSGEENIWGNKNLTDSKKKELVDREINQRLEGARNDIARYCQIYFKTHPLIQDALVFAAAGPYWQYAIVAKDDVFGYQSKKK